MFKLAGAVVVNHARSRYAPSPGRRVLTPVAAGASPALCRHSHPATLTIVRPSAPRFSHRIAFGWPASEASSFR